MDKKTEKKKCYVTMDDGTKFEIGKDTAVVLQNDFGPMKPLQPCKHVTIVAVRKCDSETPIALTVGDEILDITTSEANNIANRLDDAISHAEACHDC